jgi:type IV secretory pathway VirD2 relaxase
MVKVTGRTRDPAHLRAHLDYISRNGQLEVEGPNGARLVGRGEVRELGDDWSFAALADSRRRANSPLSLSIILSMPADTDPLKLRDAAREFATGALGDRFDYVFALHTDAAHPHVHLTVARRGVDGQRLNPKKADLESWRQRFAQALRDRGVEAEATPRRARGVTRRPEQAAVRRIGERHAGGAAPMARVRQEAYRDAAGAAFRGETAPRAWEVAMSARQARVRGLYLAQAALLRASAEGADRELAEAVEAFVRAMPAPDSQRLAMARELRAAAEPPPPGAEPSKASEARGQDRGRSR